MEKRLKAHPESLNVTYPGRRWTILHRRRERTIQVMEPLEKSHLEPIVHGSIARGDVSSRSDIDIFITANISSFALQNVLERANIRPVRLYLVQATPNYAMKAHIEIDDRITLSFPLMKMRKVEREFYKFGGQASLNDLKNDVRVVGVDKRLMLIEPTKKGHIESTIVGQEEHAARILGVSVETVLDRVHTLVRRNAIGRTGVFIKQELSAGQTFEMLLEELAEKNPAVRRRLMRQF